MAVMKYIMLNNGSCDFPVMFAKFISHSEMANKTKEFGRVVSAGFVTLMKDEITPYGESMTLNIGIRPEDFNIIKEWMQI